MNITKKQKQQLIDLNDSRVDEILDLGLKVGEWYKGDKVFQSLIYITKIANTAILNYNRLYYFGFLDGRWVENDLIANTEHEQSLIKATRQEVEEALTNEAKRIGFENVGDLSITFVDGRNFKKGFFNTSDNKFRFCKEYSTILLDGVEIFKDGVWAEIIDDKSELKEEIKELRKKLKSLEEKL